MLFLLFVCVSLGFRHPTCGPSVDCTRLVFHVFCFENCLCARRVQEFMRRMFFPHVRLCHEDAAVIVVPET